MTAASLLVVQIAEAGGRLLADGGSSPSDIDPTTGKGPEWGKAAPIGLLVIVLLCIACYFLARSFSKNLKKVPSSFDQPADIDGLAGAAASVEPPPGSAETDTSGRTDTSADLDPDSLDPSAGGARPSKSNRTR